MALANGLSSHLLQGLAPSLLSSSYSPVTGTSKTSPLPKLQSTFPTFQLGGAVQDKTESIQDLRMKAKKHQEALGIREEQ